MNRTVAALAAIAGLGSCTPWAERMAAECETYGFNRGTVEFAQCMQHGADQWNQSMQALSQSLAAQEQARQQAAYQEQLLRQQQYQSSQP